ncbi:unnamed protein product [Closterium sp. NIES-53]
MTTRKSAPLTKFVENEGRWSPNSKPDGAAGHGRTVEECHHLRLHRHPLRLLHRLHRRPHRPLHHPCPPFPCCCGASH